MDAVIIGSGNTATVLARLMKKNHHTILQIISRHIENAQQLATEINCNFANDISAINKSATIYIIAVSDSVIERIASKIKLEEKLIVHTCGAINKSARVPPAQLDLWLAILGWESVVNRKGQMWRDVGLKDWLFEIDDASGEQIGERLLAMHKDKEGTAATVAKAQAFTAERGRAMMQAVAASL